MTCKIIEIPWVTECKVYLGVPPYNIPSQYLQNPQYLDALKAKYSEETVNFTIDALMKEYGAKH